ncbi:hypothetical protein [Bacillus sp. FJAT-27251]|uniref:hypothetical protein n=1 Tax=Bacillus sp. FJAT-27251 TaxID=1684142 RepID=UPI0006A7E7EE|nr:hypothetical protein [Bacillus sp. FJAT-27251]
MNKVKEKKKCVICNLEKKIEEFYLGHGKCKKCHSKKVQFNKGLDSMRTINKLLDLKIIKRNEVTAARTLLISCESRINACKYNIGIYKDIDCKWSSPQFFMVDIIQKLPNVWHEWKIQNVIYEETKNDSDRPTIDRIDEFGDYTLTNIQMLSKHNNSKKARSKPCRVLIIHNKKIQGVFEFKSKKDLYKDLVKAGIPINTTQIKFDTGIIQEVGNGYSILLQAKDGEIARTDERFYKVIINHRRELIEEDTGKVIEVLGYWQYEFEAGTITI